MKNLELLEYHRKKVALIVAFFIFFSIYSVIFAFQFTSIYNHEQRDNEILKIKSEKIEKVIDSFNSLTHDGNEDAHNLAKYLLEDSNIYNSNGIILENIEYSDVNIQNIELDKIFFKGGYKYLKKQFGEYTYLVRILSDDFGKELGKIGLMFLIFGVILYSFISWIMCRVMAKIYRPLKETVTNLEAFTSNVNHEFKTTLTEIISSLELAEITKDYEAANSQSSGAAKRLNRILDSLGVLIHFTNSDYKKQKIDIIYTLDESLGDYTRKLDEKGIQIKKLYRKNIPIFRVIDPAPLILAFNNILKNAIKFSKANGIIEIDIQKNHFIIKDYGIGIEEENLEKIFDRYFRENYIGEGNGIGLSIIKRLSEIYNWEIIVKSKKDRFTEIKICF